MGYEHVEAICACHVMSDQTCEDNPRSDWCLYAFNISVHNRGAGSTLKVLIESFVPVKFDGAQKEERKADGTTPYLTCLAGRE